MGIVKNNGGLKGDTRCGQSASVVDVAVVVALKAYEKVCWALVGKNDMVCGAREVKGR